MKVAREEPSEGTERFASASVRDRWLDFLALEHATLPLPADFERDGDDLIVRRFPARGRKIREGRIPRDQVPLLFLQAAALCSFLQAFGFWLGEDDLTDGVWDRSPSGPRLWLSKTPRGLSSGGSGPAPAAVLAAFLHRILARGRRTQDAPARGLFDRMLASDAPWRRAEFWLASAFRTFPELSRPTAAGARVRSIGLGGLFLRSASVRARLAKGRALCEGRSVRVFESRGSIIVPGQALGLDGPVDGVARAARALREAQESAESRRPLWIAVEIERWDALSRRAFEAASRALAGQLEILVLHESATPPQLPDEWRREVFVPCGTINASLRFYERFAELARSDPANARTLAQAVAGSTGWGAFVADPTGDAVLPFAASESTAVAARASSEADREVLEALAALDRPASEATLARLLPRRSIAPALQRLEQNGCVGREAGAFWRLTRSGRDETHLDDDKRRALCLRWAQLQEEPGLRIELLLEGGDVAAALVLGEQWFEESEGAPPERWFALSSRLAGAVEDRRPIWLELLEAEREISGGRIDEARARLLAAASSDRASATQKRTALLRTAETLSWRGRHGAAGRDAAAWLAQFPDAPAAERVRALRIEANHRWRQGEHEGALRLLQQAQREGEQESLESRLETALAGAAVYAAAGRQREEEEVYEHWRRAVLEQGDDRLVARLLAHEAMSFSDRREFPGAIARFEEALAVYRDDPVERARMSIDLATALHHGGRPAACAALLQEAIVLASCAGREDLVCVARGNRIELTIAAGQWEEASREVAALLEDAQREGDELRRLVGLHQRSRIALARGLLDEAARDNAAARTLAASLRDRLEVGELWLDQGDLALYAGDLEAARHAWERAEKEPADRTDRDARARDRLRELSWREQGGPPAQAWEDLAGALTRCDYAAAVRTARWKTLYGSTSLPEGLTTRAARVLRDRGGDALADVVFGVAIQAPSAASLALRDLRDAVAAALAGEEPEAPLPALGLDGLVIFDEKRRETVALIATEKGRAAATSRILAAGAQRYELVVWPAIAVERLDAIALLLETLLYRAASRLAPTPFAEGWSRWNVLTADPSMEDPYRRLVRFAPQPVTVLVLGESGSGKEAVARAVHQLSPRCAGPFVAVNVPAIPQALLESELFGHARGAFTGADRDRRGLLEEANGGTIFFDEIGDLSLPLQAKLLRTLQEREARRVGENRARAIDVRVVSATSRALAADVERGVFREDLYYRLHVAVITLPPLRDRGRDCVLLARHFLDHFAREYGRGTLRISPEALEAISSHSWPGNVRELQNAIAQAAALAERDGLVTAQLLPESARTGGRRSTPTEGYRSQVDAHRRGLIREALERTGGNRTRAARDLGLSRQALLYLIRELNVPARPRSNH